MKTLHPKEDGILQYRFLDGGHIFVNLDMRQRWHIVNFDPAHNTYKIERDFIRIILPEEELHQMFRVEK